MNEETFKAIASQLRQPHGEHAIQVGEKMNEGNRLINLYTIDALELNAHDNILEIGMGNGFFVKEIFAAESSIHYTGCDFSETMISESRRRNVDFIKEGKANFFLAPADQLPFENETFDKVFTINTLYFWEDPKVVLAEIRRVLKPGGRLFISIRPKSVMQHYPFVKYGFNMFDKEQVVELLTTHNLNVLKVWEKDEPEQEVNGNRITVASLIVSAERT